MTYRRLRDWADPSYSPDSGRAAKSSMPVQKNYGADGEKWSVNAQLAKGQPAKNTPSWSEIDKNRCQGGDVRKRPLG